MTDSPYKRIAILLAFAATGLSVFCLGLALEIIRKPFEEVIPFYCLLAFSMFVLYAAGVAVEHRKRWMPFITEQLNKFNDYVERLPERQVIIWLTLICAAGLFGELMIIRLHSSFFQLFAHFKNVSLLSCFLGLGIGYSLSRAKPATAPLAVPLLAIQIIILAVYVKTTDLNFMLFYPSTEGADLGFFMGLYNSQRATDFMLSYGLLTFAFAMNAACFIPLGQLAGSLMAKLSNLRAYSYNLLGSLIGIVAFTLLSAAWTTPVFWFAVFSAVVLSLCCRTPAATAAGAISACLALGLLSLPTKAWQMEIYSPYQILSVLMDRENPRIFANNTWFQSMLNLSHQNVERHPELKELYDYYGLGYRFTQMNPENVLIVGSGSGNDVASALRHGAQHVDAVEIDPAIIAIGKQLHPEGPYQNDRVTIHNDDARSFIKRTNKKYDLIVYGLLDSSATMSGNLAGMRTDSYVWTLEAFREARSRLKPGGTISMTVCMCPSIGPKVYRMLEEVFDGEPPIVYRTDWDAGYTYLAGDSVYIRKPLDPSSIPFPDWTAEFKKPEHIIDMSSDDWPFLFIARRTYPFFFATVLSVLMVISIFAIRLGAPREERRLSLPFFFLGAGFMLIEAKAITELCLVFGSTWVVTAIAIGAILLLAFLANLLVLKIGPPAQKLSYLMLIASVFGSLWFNIVRPEFADMWTERLVTTFVMVAPLFFAGLVFSSEFKSTRSQSMAMASNLMGAMLGGFVEYNALYFGYRSLYILAAVMYLAAFLSSMMSMKSAKDSGGTKSDAGQVDAAQAAGQAHASKSDATESGVAKSDGGNGGAGGNGVESVVAKSGATAPDATMTDAAKPDAAKPDPAKSKAAKSKTVKAKSTKLDGTKTGGNNLKVASKSDATDFNAKSDVTKSDVTKSDATTSKNTTPDV